MGEVDAKSEKFSMYGELSTFFLFLSSFSLIVSLHHGSDGKPSVFGVAPNRSFETRTKLPQTHEFCLS